jgi:predicted membrane channel-forming protein YqfA (hemolysin III family)
MAENSARVQRRLKVAAYLLIAGLGIEAVTLYWTSPISFIFFIALSGTLVALGVIVYLVAISAA